MFNGLDAKINSGQNEGICECCGHLITGQGGLISFSDWAKFVNYLESTMKLVSICKLRYKWLSPASNHSSVGPCFVSNIASQPISNSPQAPETLCCSHP